MHPRYYNPRMPRISRHMTSEFAKNPGAACCSSARSQEAVAEFEDLLAIDPDWNVARLCLYKSLKRLGRLDEATAVKAEYDKLEASSTE